MTTNKYEIEVLLIETYKPNRYVNPKVETYEVNENSYVDEKVHLFHFDKCSVIVKAPFLDDCAFYRMSSENAEQMCNEMVTQVRGQISDIGDYDTSDFWWVTPDCKLYYDETSDTYKYDT
jgi:hypothetical protein